MRNDELVQALERAECESRLEMAFRQCLRNDDESLLDALLKASVREGVPGLAAKVLRSLPDLKRKHSKWYALIPHLEALVSGERSEVDVRARYEGIKRVLLRSNPYLRGLEETLDRAGSGVRLYETVNGHAIAILEHNRLELAFALPEIAGPEPDDPLIMDDGRNTMALLLVGVPRLEVWKRLLAWEAESGFRPPIDLVEPDARLLGVWLRLLDDPAVFEGERVGVFAGPRAWEQYEEALRTEASHMVPTRVIRSGRAHPPLPETPSALFDSIQKRRARKTAASLRKQRAMYEDCTPAEWGHRFQRAGIVESPLRVIGITTRHSTVMQYAMRDLAGAFGREGCEFELITEPHAHTSTIDVAQLLSRRECDLVVVINHLRPELGGEVHEKIPYVCWIQDHMPMLWNPQAGRSVGDYDLVLGQSQALMTRQFDYPARRFLETNNLTDPGMYRAEPIDEKALEPYRCAVSYVSHGSATPEDLLEVMIRDEKPPFQRCLTRVLELLVEQLADRPFLPILELAELILRAEREARCPDLTPEVRVSVLLQKTLTLQDRILRHQTLQWTSRWAESRGQVLKLYGRGWCDHPSLGHHATGEIENGFPLRCVYQASRINLQVNGFGSMHQRLLDGLASGGFMLVRRQPADVLRNHYEDLQDLIFRHRLDLEALERRRQDDGDLEAVLVKIERLEGLRLAPMTDSIRRRQVQLQASVFNLPAKDNDDAALLRRLCTLEHFPRRIAGDLPGYEACAFEDEESLHAMLDRFVDDEAGRAELVEPMRCAVLDHDTYDILVKRILGHYRSLGVDEDAVREPKMIDARDLKRDDRDVVDAMMESSRRV